MSEGPEKGFKRLNFFRGQKADWSDWADEIDYRVKKHRLHNRYLHGPGIVRDLENGLHVSARGDMTVEVKPGFALDGEGNELNLDDVVIKTISTSAFKEPREYVYIVLRYVEEPTDFIAYKHNLAIKGHRRILETSEVAVVTVEPKVHLEVELARILVERDAKVLRDAKDPRAPEANEVDLRFAPVAGTAGTRLNSKTRNQLTECLTSIKRALALLGGVQFQGGPKYMTPHSAMAALSSTATLNHAGLIDHRNYYDIVGLVIEMVSEVYGELKMYDPDILKRPEMMEFANQMAHVHTLWKERRANQEAMQVLAKAFANSAEYIIRLFYPQK